VPSAAVAAHLFRRICMLSQTRERRWVAAAIVFVWTWAGGGLHWALAAEPAVAYPSRPLRVIVGFPAGGPVDVQARIVMQRVSDSLQQSIVVDNRAGADGALANTMVAQATPDGYTLLYGSAGHVINKILRGKSVPYDAIRDFTPVGLLTQSAFVLATAASFPANSVSDLVAMARAKPGSISYASSGSGSTPHLATEYLRMMAKIELVHVPYKGAVPGMNDVMGGRVPFTILGPPPALPHIRSGRLKALAVTGAKRMPILPQVPTIAESGFPGYEVAAWYGFFGPARLPAAIVATLNRELRAALDTPDVREKLAVVGLETVGSSPAEHRAHLEADFVRWTPVVKASGMKLD